MFLFGVSAAMEPLPDTQPVTLRGSIEEVCAVAKDSGYDALELHVRDPKRYDPEAIRTVTERFGLPVCAVANGMEYTVSGLSLIDDDADRRKAATLRLQEHADFAAALGAKLIVGIMRGNIPKGAPSDVYVRRFAGALTDICAYAQARGADVVLESIMRYINNYLCGVPETMDFITSLGCRNLSLHLDTHSMAVEEKDLAASIRYCRGKPLGYVHYSDNNRLYPGGGALDFKAMTHALMDIGYDGYITVECLPVPNPEESARRGLCYMKNIAEAAEIERRYQQITGGQIS